MTLTISPTLNRGTVSCTWEQKPNLRTQVKKSVGIAKQQKARKQGRDDSTKQLTFTSKNSEHSGAINVFTHGPLY